MDQTTKAYRLVHGEHTAHHEGERVVLAPGAIMHLTERKARALTGKVQPLDMWGDQGQTVTRDKEAAPPLPDEPPETREGLEELLLRYHEGFGRYELPGIGKVRGKKDAIDALAEHYGIPAGPATAGDADTKNGDPNEE